jgi:hypothetical protein
MYIVICFIFLTFWIYFLIEFFSLLKLTKLIYCSVFLFLFLNFAFFFENRINFTNSHVMNQNFLIFCFWCLMKGLWTKM